uniref:Putative secreted protein n=1 Tax=Amblyomma cajennense TaxID=34607 RepID=A0A023FE19_AMBCJ
MRSLIFLTLLALISSTLALVIQVNTKKGMIHINETFFDAPSSDCPNEEPNKCPYRRACYCRPPMHTYMRLKGYFYSPEHNRCFKSENMDVKGCNTFKKWQECFSKCVYGKRPGMKKTDSRKKKI